MQDINLLPVELKPNSSVVKAAKKIGKINLILGSFLILFILTLLGTLFFYSEAIKGSREEQKSLEEGILALSATEQRLVLIKDRISKISEVFSKGSTFEETKTVRAILGLLPENLTIDSITFDREVLKVDVAAENLTQAGEYIKRVVEGDFGRVNLISFGFDPLSGYKISLQFTQM